LTFAVSWGLGAVTLRLSGHYLPLCTIAWGLSLYFLFGNLAFLGGHTGITGLPALTLFGFSMASPRALGVLAWVVLLIVLWGLSNLLDSREGRAVRALKSSRIMAESMGIDTARSRIKAFVLAGLLAAISGWLYAHLQRFVNPTPFNLNIGIEYLFMAVVGGAGHLWGAVLGATLITLLKQRLQDWLPQLLGASGNFEVIAFGLLMLFVLQRFPRACGQVWRRGGIDGWALPGSARAWRCPNRLMRTPIRIRGGSWLQPASRSPRRGLRRSCSRLHRLPGASGDWWLMIRCRSRFVRAKCMP
jgi:branched-chain amino acid transport system permease protein